ncbi:MULTISPECIES: hypothetical protein [Winogradskyella]|uniref:Uncharacterized protein n=1 Tax=Winogradskyella marincola TaxID=3037795 RepID=A0ABT6G1L8_9FLAO|nr:hypothetical protein [Winogradskyella sp. YYF002]MDG4715928.1 hypothetical protein [Winogradskyella sp. YYF002]
MKTLKITLALLAVAMLTVSGVQSDKNETAEKTNIHQPTKIDLLAHEGKKEIKMPEQG